VSGVVVLGATGSIGLQALDVCERLGLEVVGLASGRPSRQILELSTRFPTAAVAVSGGSGEERSELAAAIGQRAEFGADAVVAMAAKTGVTVVNGIVGAAGLRPSIAALEAGNRLGLANKESLVAAGPLVLDAARRGGGELIPVDSEHSALHQLLSGVDRSEVASLVITASGGPFLGKKRPDLEDVTPAQAMAHPTWTMGGRITVDSATLANKGLEVIEAHVLFGVDFDQIEVVIHPQSLVHSFVRLTDGALLAHVGHTDMRIPIQYALTYPERTNAGLDPFELAGRTLSFEEPDTDTFSALPLAFAAGRAGGAAPAVFNAADEVAVAAFVQGRLGFLGIAGVIERTLADLAGEPAASIDEVLETDRRARQLAASLVAGVC